MRYFIKSDASTNDVKRIAGEIINISLSRNYFINGVINPTPDLKTNYNTYDIDNVAYEIHPNVGVVIILGDRELRERMNDSIKQTTADFERQVYATHGVKKPSVGRAGTTQYLLIEDPSTVGMVNISFLPMHSDLSKIPEQASFTWLVTDQSDFIELSTYYRKDRGMSLYSLSSIVYDTVSAFQLPDGYLSPDYPDVTDTTSYKKDLVIKNTINVGVTCGLYLEIAKLFGALQKKKKSTRANGLAVEFIYTPFPSDRVLNWIKWSDVKPVGTEVSVLNTMELIKRGLLDFDESRTDESDSVVTSNTYDYKCFVTGVPIYEDTYVFDIYQQLLEDVIDINDLNKYPGAEIVPIEVKKEETADVKTVLTSDPDPLFAGLTDDNIRELRDAAVGYRDVVAYCSRRIGQRHREKLKKATAAKIKAELKKKAKLDKSKLDGKPDKSKSDGKPDKSKSDIPPSKKMPIKRGQKKPIELVKIRRVINYDTARHVLVSPFYMHCMELKDAVAEFEKNTGTKVLVFRTFSPRTLKNVIDSIPDLQPAHRQFLHEFNASAVRKVNCFKTENIDLVDVASMGMVMDANTTNRVIGEFECFVRE